ncbi:MAG: urease accessory UreF family protein [Celeribacter sp.]|jgi:urease accessory protein
MSAPHDTTDPGALLTLTQWLSPAFPLGSFAYSHGLEAEIAAGRVRDADSLRDWVAMVLQEGAGRADAILLAHALRAGGDAAQLSDLADLAHALAPSRERWIETQAQGRALTLTVNAMTSAARPVMALPVALGAAAAGLGLAVPQVLALYLHSFAANLVQAGVRFVPLGQTEGQAALAALHPGIVTLAGQCADAPLDAIGTGAFGADLAAMEHEVLDVRIFKT